MMLVVFQEAFSQTTENSIDDIFFRKEFINISVENGLSNNLITAITQDSIGYLWIGTADGLCRYGGNDFKIFRKQQENSNSLGNNYIHDLKYDHKNQALWIATSGGLEILSLKTQRFSAVKKASGSLLSASCRSLDFSPDGTMFALLIDGSIIGIQESDTTLYKIPQNKETGANFLDLHVLTESQVVVTTNNEYILTYDLEAKSVLHQQYIDTDELNYFVKLDGKVAITSEVGLLIKEEHETEFKFPQSQLLSNSDIVTATLDSDQKLWIGTRDRGLFLSDEPVQDVASSDIKFTEYKPDYDGTSVYGKTIQVIFEDNNRGIWLGTWSAGLNYINLDPPAVHLIKHNPIRPESISHNRVWGICYGKNRLWIGTDGGGLNSYDIRTGDNKIYQSSKEPNTLSGDAILCSIYDSQGYLWFGTYKGGLNRFDPNTRRFKSFLSDDNNAGSINRNDVRLLFEDSRKRLWIGTNRGGLQIFNRSDESFYNVPNFENSDIRRIVEDKKGGFWISIYGDWFSYYNPETNKFRKYDKSNINELERNRISSMELKGDILWIGTRLNGLFKFNIISETYEHFEESNGLINNSIRSMALDSEGDLWIATDRGISLLNPSTNRFRNYGVANGVQSGEFNVGSVLKLDSDWICFGGTKGLNILNTKNLKNQKVKNDILISGITVFDTPLTEIENNLSPLYSDEYDLSYDKNVLKFDYEVLNFPFASNELFYYQLEGNDDKWNIARRSNSITYANLKPASYALKLALPNLQNEPDYIKILNFEIKPPFWRTGFAYVSYFLISLAIIWLILRYYTKQIQLRSSLLYEKKIRSQERELNKERIRFFTNFSHELRTPITLILGPLKSIISKQQGTESTNQLELIYRNALKLGNLINKMLDFRKAQSDQMKLKFRWINITNLLNEILSNYRDLAKVRGIELSFLAPEDTIEMWVDVEKLEIIMNNLLSNAFKYTDKGGHVKVNLKNLEDSIECSISDSGIGMPEEDLQSIFQWYFQAGDSKNVSGTGIGLALSQKLVELHGGTITAESKVGEGSKFTFTIDKMEPNEEEKGTDIEAALTLELPKDLEISNVDGPSEFRDVKKERILVVDDNPDIVQYISQVLSTDYFIFTAVDGEKGIESAFDEIPDLIISDVMMPEKSGIDLCKVLKSDRRTSHIPIILLTAKHSVEDTVIGYAEGADSYMTKPFDEEVLSSRVRNLLKNRVLLKSYFLSQEEENPINRAENQIEDIRSQKEMEFLNKVEETILGYLSDGGQEVGVYDLSKELGFSRASLYRKLKSVSGYSINEFIRKVRLKKANELISTGDMNVSEAAFYVGFNDIKYFRSIFKKEFNRLPSDVKNDAPERLL